MRVLVDNGVLSSFRARALKAYPIEYGEFLWGTVETDDDVVISVIDRCDISEADEDNLEMDTPYEFGEVINGLTLLGTIHSHPDGLTMPSDSDLASASEDPPEKVFGIISLSRENKRWLTGYAFFLPSGQQVELVVSKPTKAKKLKNVQTTIL